MHVLLADQNYAAICAGWMRKLPVHELRQRQRTSRRMYNISVCWVSLLSNNPSIIESIANILCNFAYGYFLLPGHML